MKKKKRNRLIKDCTLSVIDLHNMAMCLVNLKYTEYKYIVHGEVSVL